MSLHSFIVFNNRVIVNSASGEVDMSTWAVNAGYNADAVNSAMHGYTFEDGIFLYRASNPEEIVIFNELVVSALATWYSGHYNHRPERLYLGRTSNGFPVSVVSFQDMTLGIPTEVEECCFSV